jgi:hypothetical protein
MPLAIGLEIVTTPTAIPYWERKILKTKATAARKTIRWPLNNFKLDRDLRHLGIVAIW